MNSFKRFLLSEENIKVSHAQAAEMIFRDCQPFLKEIDYRGRDANGLDNNLYLYRGMNGEAVGSYPFLKNEVYHDRKPRDMPIEYHKALDSYLYKKFGIKFRSNAIFVTGELGRAQSYGTVHMIFPIGEFKFIWEENIGDIWEDMVFSKHFLDVYPKYVPPSGSEDPVDIFSHMLKIEDYYKDTDLETAILSGNEIMINCKNYYAVSMATAYGRGLKDYLSNLAVKN